MKNVGNSSDGHSQGVLKISGHPCIGRMGALRGHLCDSTAFLFFLGFELCRALIWLYYLFPITAANLNSRVKTGNGKHTYNSERRLYSLSVGYLKISQASGFYARQHICYSANSVRLSVTRVYCVKTAERIIEILSPSGSPIILVFSHQGSLRKSDGVTPNGGAKYKGVAIFDHYAAISWKWY